MAKKKDFKDQVEEVLVEALEGTGATLTTGDGRVLVDGEAVAETPKKASAEVIEKVIADTVEEITRFMPRLRASEEENDDAAKAAKDAKKTMEGNHLHLSMLCRRLADAKNGNYQPPLPFDKAEADEPGDDGATKLVAVLKDYGLTDKMVETLVDHDVKTIGDLEALIAADEWWHRKFKGFGEERVTKLIDSLVAFRADNPIPSSESDDDAEG